MDGFVAIIIIWAIFGVVSSSIKKKKKAANDAAHKPAEVPPTKPVPQKPSVWEQIDMMNMMTMDKEDEEGESANDTPAPGSITDYKPMAQTQEGLSQPGSLARAALESYPLASAPDKDAGTAFKPNAARAAARISSRDMKGAVIMSEILNRPVSIRRNAGGIQKWRCRV